MSENNGIKMLQTKEMEDKKLILADVHSELVALGDMVSKLLSDTDDMEEETPNGIKLIFRRIQEQVMNVLN